MRNHYHISWQADRFLIKGDMEEQVAKLDANGFFKDLLNLPNRRCVDFLRIAAATYMVDRICRRRIRVNNECGTRDLHITFEVEDTGFWQQADIVASVAEIIQFLTGDDWMIKFSAAKQESGNINQHGYLRLAPFTPDRVGMYSGGLDSAAGLANRFLGGKQFLLVTVDHQSGLHSRVKKQLKALSQVLQNNGLGAPVSEHSTLKVSLVAGKSKHMGTQEKTQRSRAFLFSAAAMIAASAYDVEVIEMFENGVGAINLPLMSGMLGNNLATRGSHPTFLGMMSTLSSKVAERQIRFELPFESVTKAEMVQELNGVTGLAAWALTSRSCVHSSIRIKGRPQCGQCPACIERRQAFRVAGVEEDVGDYLVDIFSEGALGQVGADYFKLYRLDALDWLEDSDKPKRRLERHLQLTGLTDKLFANTAKLQVKHSREIIEVFGSPF